jgi:hypothetical protein
MAFSSTSVHACTGGEDLAVDTIHFSKLPAGRAVAEVKRVASNLKGWLLSVERAVGYRFKFGASCSVFSAGPARFLCSILQSVK